MIPAIETDMERRRKENKSGILFVDVCSVKEYPRKIMLDLRKFCHSYHVSNKYQKS
jgi:hypothetical protein